ncbi:ABC transporter substrate-binding protein [Agromyces archimandritae]|uniref:ABC transporter substrate-binding protein n=1 Tax=Agromyces archimandritae TaxID=2781962 RepID=A0A975FPM2_9MICO|nr:ABC transporter substrate-binding protein [Agromyces archimandritae]QTX05712.1 ABC transporter substrate-binding protein [Agromyces archimandritae]
MQRAHRRLLIPAAAAATFALALTGCSSSNFGGGDAAKGDDEGPIKIGAVLDITGVGANLGVPEQNTLKMLAEQLEEAGGIDGREVELIIKDNQSTEDGAAKATSELIENEDVDLLIGASRTGPSLAMRPIAEAAKIPTISVAANASIVDGSEWLFKTAQNDLVVLEVMLDDAKAKGYKKVDLARDATGFGEGIAEIITELGAERGIELGKVEAFEPSATDFTAQMTNLRGTDSDAVVIWGITPSAGLAQAAYAQLGVGKPVYQSHGVANAAFFEAAGDAATGVIAPMGRLLVHDQLSADDPQKEVIEQFVADYTEAYGDAPSSFAGHAYDAWQVAIAALEEAGTDPEALRDAIEGTTGLVGVSGVFNMTAEDHSGLSTDALILAEGRDGRWNLVK